MAKFYRTYSTEIHWAFVVGVLIIVEIAVFTYFERNKIKCFHEKQIVEWRGSFYDITIHNPNCPDIER